MKFTLFRPLCPHDREQRAIAGALLDQLEAAERREPKSLASLRARKRGRVYGSCQNGQCHWNGGKGGGSVWISE